MQRTKKIQWTSEELELLTRLHPLFSSKKWKKISELFRQNGFIRTEIECRQKWINFLDPSLNKDEWKQEELEKLYEIHEQVGTKWCLVQKQIGRTQNKIKNRFYGTLRNYIRFIVCYFESNHRYNYEISKLPPNFLNDLYRSENNFKFLNDQIKKSIYLMRFTLDKKYLGERIENMRPLYQRLREVIFKTFVKIKGEKQFTMRKGMNKQIQSENSLNQQIQRLEQSCEQSQSIVQNIVANQYPFAQISSQQIMPIHNYFPFLQYDFPQQNCFFYYL